MTIEPLKLASKFIDYPPSDDKSKFCHDCKWFRNQSEYSQECTKITYRTLNFGQDYFENWALVRGDESKCGFAGKWWEPS